MSQFFYKILSFLKINRDKPELNQKNMTIGRSSYYGERCTFIARDGGQIKIGNFCSLANGVTILNGCGSFAFDDICGWPFRFHLSAKSTSLF